MKRIVQLIVLFLVTALASSASVSAGAKPIRVFILAGQSNMEGQGRIAADPAHNGGKGSLEYLVKNPVTAKHFGVLVDAAGQWRKRDNVWISYLDRKGQLTVGYGARKELIGPELGFGWVMGDAFDEPVLLIKCAWGGKSLAVDFRPPSAGKPPYSLGAATDAEIAQHPEILGKYYREILTQVKAALADIKNLVPGSDGKYVLSGIGWHQGWNDRISDKFNAEYESNLTHFIQDIRKDLGAPTLPFVIAETGMNGPTETHPRALSLMKAQAAVAEHPEFKGNVAFVGTKAFWRAAEESPSAQGYHWNSNAETYYLIGEAMGEAMKRLLNIKGSKDSSAAAQPNSLPKSLPNALPNIVVILADDLGYGDIGCYNDQSKVPTPNLDRLAHQGMRFTDAHAPSTVCTPSRYSLLTGRMAFRIPYRGVFEGVGGPCLIKEDQLTLPQMLRNRGYTTAMTGKWHVGLTFFDKEGQRITKGGVEGVKLIDYSRAIPDAPIHRGFDQFFGTACCSATDYLYAYINGDRIPVPPTKMLDKSKLPKHPYAFDNREGMIAPDYNLEEVDMVFLKKSREFLEQVAKRSSGKPFFLLHALDAVHLPSFASKKFQGSTKAGPHGDFIFELDYIVGELMKTLERLGMADNTVVMVTPDSKSDETVCLTDVMATCAAITNVALPDNAAQDSFDLLPLLLGKPGDRATRPYTLHQTISLALAIRKGSWKYLDHRGSGGNDYNSYELKPFALPDTAPDAPGQLYNLATDPGEKVNLYYTYPEIVKELKALLEESKAAGRSASKKPGS